MTLPTLTERLGYGPADRLLIINCDDLGSSHSANLATFHAMTQGIATSASLMVPCPWAKDAARIFKAFPIGVHLTLTSEYSTYRWPGLTGGPSLHDDTGFLPATTALAVQRLTESDARAECRAQIDTAFGWGLDVTHLDTHMNVLQGRHDLHEIYLDLAEEYRLPIRMLPPRQTADPAFPARDRANARGLLFNEHIIYPWPRRTRDVFFEEIPNLPPGVSEIFAHPVFDGPELRGYDTTNADIRTHDAACLTDPTVAGLLDRHNIKRINYRTLRDLYRAGKR